MSEKYYRNSETNEVVTVADGAEDVYADEMVEETTNKLYQEISAAEAGVVVEVAEEVAEEEAPEEAPAEEEEVAAE